jgi:hypothetical protein
MTEREKRTPSYLGERPKPNPIGCYDGTKKTGEVVDWGRGGVEAFVARNGKMVRIGIFASRKLAAAAVAEAVDAK